MKLGSLKIFSLINLILLGLLLAMWIDTDGTPRNVRWNPPAALTPDFSHSSFTGDVPQHALDPVQYMSILERPIFAPDRRPPPPPAPPPPPDPMANVQISAVMTGQYAGVLARVEGRMQRVKVGDGIGAWTLQSVEGREATFVSGDETRKLQLTYSKFGVPNLTAAPTGGPSSGGAGAGAVNPQDEARERLRRRNEIRAARGLPPVTD